MASDAYYYANLSALLGMVYATVEIHAAYFIANSVFALG